MKRSAARLEAGDFCVIEQVYSSGHRIARHAHDAAEFCLVLSGGLTETLDGGTSLSCRPGEATFKPAGEEHQVSSSSEGARLLVVTVSPSRSWHGPTAVALQRPASFPGALAGFGARMKRELQSRDECTPLAVEGIALEMLAVAARERADSRNGRDVPPWVSAVRDRIHEEACRGSGSLSLSGLAQEAGVGATCLAQAFRRAFGTSVGGFVRRRRVAEARRRLLSEDESLTSVALACGFYDQSHLTRVFRRETGLTPARYRSEHRG